MRLEGGSALDLAVVQSALNTVERSMMALDSQDSLEED